MSKPVYIHSKDEMYFVPNEFTALPDFNTFTMIILCHRCGKRKTGTNVKVPPSCECTNQKSPHE